MARHAMNHKKRTHELGTRRSEEPKNLSVSKSLAADSRVLHDRLRVAVNMPLVALELGEASHSWNVHGSEAEYDPKG